MWRECEGRMESEGRCVDVLGDVDENSCRTFFFQAEDGIRDLVRSRGLGDVYKRQPWCSAQIGPADEEQSKKSKFHLTGYYMVGNTIASVSYTHLTLPTSDLV